CLQQRHQARIRRRWRSPVAQTLWVGRPSAKRLRQDNQTKARLAAALSRAVTAPSKALQGTISPLPCHRPKIASRRPEEAQKCLNSLLLHEDKDH
ncbi:uncharacterized protein L969DRAFT_25959, partial [Mixia osmundae IAM 14324]|uniref:uncharacterized protein n=1 Tax=Mixia osmundae (strain CBS 9802 / IAM 14324 / JCM 22182 / KY 12970) TaxID=764103 RepID=UPI0004A548BA